MKKIDNSIKITGMILVSIIILTLITVLTIGSFVDKKTITSQGEAVISVMPDIVAINFMIETNASTAKDANDENSDVSDKVVDSLMGLGFKREEVETISFYVNEEYDWTEDGRKSIGFKAVHNIRVKFETEDQPELGPIVDAGIDSGALLQYISFELSPELESQYTAQALKLAGADAKLKAEAMVTGVDGRLGRLISVGTTSFGYQPWRAYDTKVMSLEAEAVTDSNDESTSIQIGEKEITGRISVVYEIK